MTEYDQYAFMPCDLDARPGPFNTDADAYCDVCQWHWLMHTEADRLVGQAIARRHNHPSATKGA